MHGCNKSDFLLLNLIGDKLNFMTDSGHLRRIFALSWLALINNIKRFLRVQTTLYT